MPPKYTPDIYDLTADAYEAAAEEEARTGVRPPCDLALASIIDEDPFAYNMRVKAYKYALAMEKVLSMELGVDEG